MLKNIWGTNKNENYFRKKFSLAEKPKNAYLRIFADTGYRLFINGRFVAELDEWHNNRDYNAGVFLKKGENVIAVHGMNHSGHRGLAAELAADGCSVFCGRHILRTGRKMTDGFAAFQRKLQCRRSLKRQPSGRMCGTACQTSDRRSFLQGMNGKRMTKYKTFCSKRVIEKAVLTW